MREIHAVDITRENRGATLNFVRDITQRKKLEGQLRHAQKGQAKEVLAEGIVHDFNNILSIIVGNAEMAMDEIEEQSPAQENLKEIHQACLRARALVGKILSSARQTEQG